MSLYLMRNGCAVEDVSTLFNNAEEAMESYVDEMVIDAPSYVRVGWTWDGFNWNEPVEHGRGYDRLTDRLIPHDEYREILHQRTSNDTLQAMRKLRENDTSYDWQGWLDKLDAYNKAVEDTQYQETYPDKVTYPTYPER